MKINDSQYALLLFFIFMLCTTCVVTEGGLCRESIAAAAAALLYNRSMKEAEFYNCGYSSFWIGLYSSYQHDVIVTSLFITWSISSWSYWRRRQHSLSHNEYCQHGGTLNATAHLYTLHWGTVNVIIENNLERRKPQRKLALISSPLISSPAGVLSNHPSTQPGWLLTGEQQIAELSTQCGMHCKAYWVRSLFFIVPLKILL